ncbi:MAG TPA: alpha/beta fold hydrolase, partial [Gemmatimonadaceae bacterium]|nr:alpha/beta fold hydrolase [Gemmatimonadaceae bacterium]
MRRIFRNLAPRFSLATNTMHLHYRFFALALFAARPATGAEPLEGRWQGAISHAAKEWPVRIDLVREGGAVNAYLDFPAYGLYYRRARLDMARDSVRLTYISGRDTVIFAGAQKGPLFAGTWRGLGISSTFALRRLGDVPPRIVEEAVHFANGRVALAGTLVRPAGPGRSPAVVWTHGSGKQSRETDFYRDRAYLLAERGVAALIYDKRGVGESTGDSDATLDELAGDAIAAVDYLRSRRDIKADQIGVGGFSQGGYVSPLAAARSDHIAFVVVGSAPGVSPGEQNDYAAASALRRIGLGADTIQHAMRLRADVVRFQRTGAGQSEVESAINAARSERWSRAADLPSPPLRQLSPRGLSVLDFDPARVWRQVRVPVLAMWGADDQLVPAEKSKSVIEDALMPSTRAKSTLRVFPNASHGLLVVSPSNAEWDWPRLTPGFHDLMTEWILAATKSDKSTASASQACAGCVPLPEHPRPDFQRADWQNLNGAWRFRLDPGDVGARENWQSRALVSPRGIVVPFSWAAPLSEIGDSASNVGWYERTIQVPSGWRGKRVFLVVGASDWRTTAWLDGVKLGEHQGGYTPFSFELTPRLTFRGQRLTIRVDDTPHPFKLEGKQGYGQAKGIWQTVYLEARGTTPLAWVHFTPNIDRNLVGVDVKLLEPATRRTTVRVDITNRADKPSATRTIASGSDRARFEIALPAARRWSLDDPFLHEATVTVSGRGVPDRVGSYFGMRKISVTKLPGTTIPYVSLNNSPVYLQLALDQAYHPTGYYTFPTDSFTRMEIQRAKEIGLNGLREHIKIETPRKLYWADRLGLFIMADVPNWWGPPDSTAFREHENALRGMIDRDYNHPAVFAWVMFN